MKTNPHYQELKREYIFPIIERKLDELKAKTLPRPVINLGIGDVALPLAPSIISAVCSAMEEMGRSTKGYAPAEGYLFLREAIAQSEFAHVGLSPEEIFISDGANSDAANIQELFSLSCSVAITDPTYPVYRDTNVMAGRGDRILSLPCTKENGFIPQPPDEHCDLVYLCSPNNPTGVAMNRTDLKRWVDWAKKTGAVLLYDNAYEAFITSPDVPKTIFEIEGAKEVAVEFRSFSKSAGFTGLRCAYTVLPKGPLHAMWTRRQSTKFNGVAYPVQRAAEAVYSPQGRKETQAQVASYMAQARTLREGLQAMGYECAGGVDAPYIWWKTPNGLTSWEFFDRLLTRCHLISIPGTGFGSHGEGYVRLSTFTTEEHAQEALRRIKDL